MAEAVSASTKGSGQEHNNSESTDTVQGQEFCWGLARRGTGVSVSVWVLCYNNEVKEIISQR